MLRNLANDYKYRYKFGNLFDGLVCNIFICSVLDKEIAIKLLMIRDVDSNKVLELVKNQALIRWQVQTEKSEEETVDFEHSIYNSGGPSHQVKLK